MRLLVVGAGATGGYFGGRLAEAGRDVTFLVRPSRAAAIARDGLRIKSPHGDVTLHPKTMTADAIDGPFDAVLLTVKAYGLEQAIADLAPAVGPETMIVPVLNGMRHMDLLIERFGDRCVLGGVCLVATTLDADGAIVQLARMQELGYGERDGSLSERVRALDAFMQGAGFTARLSERIMPAMWEKWIFLATIGGLTCLMRGTVGDIEAVPGGADIARRMLGEAIAVAEASGFPPSEARRATVTAQITERGSKNASSMYRDLVGGGDVEADQIIGDMVARAKGFGHDPVLLAAAYAHLKVYQNSRSKGA